MKRRIFAGLLSLLLVSAISCTSDKKDEAKSGNELAANDDISAQASPDAAAGGEQAAKQDSAGLDGDVQADLGADAALDKPADQAATPANPEQNDLAQLEKQNPGDAGAPAAEAAPAPAEPPAADASLGAGDPTQPPSTEVAQGEAPKDDLFGGGAAEKPKASLKKVKDIPDVKDGKPLNTVYITREGDTLDSVSQKIFGGDHKKELKKMNAGLKSKPSIGTKIYYNSPNRPNDAEKVLTYYEDTGVPSQMYAAKEGDNIKDVAKTLIGNKESWKELWATNPAVESKGVLPPGTEMRYWPQGAGGAPAAPPAPEQTIAKNDVPPPPPPPPAPQQQPPGGNPMAAAAGSMNPPGGDLAPPPPPPPAPAEMAPPPPPPPPQPKKPAKVTTASAEDKDTTFLMSVGGVLLAGMGLLALVIRKNRQKKMKMGETQI